MGGRPICGTIGCAKPTVRGALDLAYAMRSKEKIAIISLLWQTTGGKQPMQFGQQRGGNKIERRQHDQDRFSATGPASGRSVPV